MVAYSAVVVASLASYVLAIPAAAPVEKVVRTPIRRAGAGKQKDVKAVIEHGLARLGHYNNNHAKRASSATVTNSDSSYLAALTVGNQVFDLIIDTGSSNTWVGADTKFNGDGTNTRASFEVEYGSGTVSGSEWNAPVSFAGLTVSSQSVGVATSTSGFDGVDGILGVGPVDLTANTVSGAATVPTFLDNLVKQGSISTEVLGVYFKPESGSDDDDANGELTLGGTDSSKFTGSITYVPKSTTSPFSRYWGVVFTNIKYGSTTLQTGGGAIVDTGTTFIYLPTSTYNKFVSASGGKVDSSTGLVKWTSAPTGTFTFAIGSVSLTLSPSQYLFPSAQHATWGLPASGSYAYFIDGGSSGVDAIIGQKVLESYYSVFDTTNARIGFAPRA